MSVPVVLRAGLVAFVALWLFGPTELRAAVPVWVPFAIALGLELQLFLGGRRPAARGAPPDRRPQEVDRERFGYAGDDLLLVRREGEELWVPYAGESGEELEALIEEARARGPAAAAAAAPPRPVARLLTGLAVIAALGALVWAVERGGGWRGLDDDVRAAATQRFSAEASRIVGRPVSIRCDEAGEYVGAVQHADGVAVVGGTVAYLTPERCHDLYLLAFEGEIRFSRTARSLAVLAHEAWHLRGVRDEGTTECYALQSGVRLGVRLGLSGETARRMMRQRLVENPRGRSLEYVVPPECRDGGGLDLDPPSAEFP